MKLVATIVGARPNFMKAAPIDRALEKYKDTIEHVIVHTGQHYDAAMSDAFFNDLNMPKPTAFLGVGSGSHGEQTARVIVEFEKFCIERKPDLVIVVGDVNSTIACALTAVKLGIKVAHVEAGLRSGDRGMPEEVNRIATDAICDYCFTTEASGTRHLLESGFPTERIFFVGNSMIDSQYYALDMAKKSDVLEKHGLKKGEYALATIHRPSNVDFPDRLKLMLEMLAFIGEKENAVFPVHPRTRKNISKFGLEHILDNNKNVILIEPQGYIDFLALTMNCDFVATDSGGIQEETTALGVPCLTFRTSTERPSTIELGTNILIEPEEAPMRTALKKMLAGERKQGTVPELWDGKAGERIAKIIAEKILA